MVVLKRNGKKVDFDKQKIETAINKAYFEVYAKDAPFSGEIADEIEKAVRVEGDDIDVEDIQDMVEDMLMEEDRVVAKAYIRYRYKRKMARNTTDNTIMEYLSGSNEYWNNENSNKDAKVVTTQRDYLAGITSTDIARRIILPQEVVEAHDKGIIHQHDMDYLAQSALSNCFSGDMKFISIDGVRPFCSYKNGDETLVPTHTGEWKKAKVKKYGTQKINKVTLKRGPWSERIVYVTENHRWLLKNGQETTSLTVGDCLISTPNISNFMWEDLSLSEKQLWCKGFAYGDGRTQHFAACDYTNIRLCGEKNKYVPCFREAGYKVTYPPCQNGDASVSIPNFDKNQIPEMTNPENFKIFTHGYLCADGHRTVGPHSSTKNEFRGIQVTGGKKCEDVYNLLNKSGYYVSSSSDLTNQITNYGERTDTTFLYYFQAEQSYRNWRVVDIQKDVRECEVWCLEVEDNHSFILEGGIVTGNCCLINLEDMLLNGTVINGVTIEPQHRLSTAVTVATQLITAVASSQYGGCTISLTHLAPFVRMSYSAACEKYKRRGETQEKIEKYAMEDLKREIKDAVQTFNYQVNSMSTTNGQAPFLSVFMWAHENPEYEKETVMLIEEFLHQRIKGMKNEAGVYITPAFPKLLYLLDENNSNENSPYWWLTTLAAECTAKRMVPDYISAKIMKELKINRFGNGDVYPCINKTCA